MGLRYRSPQSCKASWGTCGWWHICSLSPSSCSPQQRGGQCQWDVTADADPWAALQLSAVLWLSWGRPRRWTEVLDGGCWGLAMHPRVCLPPGWSLHTCPRGCSQELCLMRSCRAEMRELGVFKWLTSANFPGGRQREHPSPCYIPQQSKLVHVPGTRQAAWSHGFSPQLSAGTSLQEFGRPFPSPRQEGTGSLEQGLEGAGRARCSLAPP